MQYNQLEIQYDVYQTARNGGRGEFLELCSLWVTASRYTIVIAKLFWGRKVTETWEGLPSNAF
jgi:hypothetical protein